MFIDSSRIGDASFLVLCLLYNKKEDDLNIRSAIPLLLSTSLEENYKDLERVLEIIRYNYRDRNWMVVSDLKVLNSLIGA